MFIIQCKYEILGNGLGTTTMAPRYITVFIYLGPLYLPNSARHNFQLPVWVILPIRSK